MKGGDEMDAAYRRDYAVKYAVDEVIRALDGLSLNTGAMEKLPPKTLDKLHEAREVLKHESDHIVAVWD